MGRTRKELNKMKKSTLKACDYHYNDTRDDGVDRFRTKDYNKFIRLVNEAETMDDIVEIFLLSDRYMYIHDLRVRLLKKEFCQIDGCKKLKFARTLHCRDHGAEIDDDNAREMEAMREMMNSRENYY